MKPPQTTKALLRRLALPALFFVVISVSWYRRGHQPQPPPPLPMSTFAGQTMGTTFTVKVQDQLSPEQEQRVQARIQSELDAVNASMSTYMQDSELSRFNRQPVGEPMVASQGLLAVVDAARVVWGQSGGAFDPTVAPLVDLWGFGPKKGRHQDPPAATVQAALALVGLEQLIQNEDTLTRTVPAVRLDLSAIAKGYGVDRVSMALRELGFDAHMVEVGGEVRAGLPKSSGEPWRIAVETPDGLAGIQEVVPLVSLSMATSGDYRNYFEDHGVRRSHTIDARSGYPVTHGLASVTVLHEQCVMADAYATAISVLGPEQGMALAQELDIAAMLLVRDGEHFSAQYSASFPRPAGPE